MLLLVHVVLIGVVSIVLAGCVRGADAWPDHPVAPAPEELPSTFRKDYRGTADRECVETAPEENPDGVFRSGEFVAGAFAAYHSEWAAGRQSHGKLWWQPLHVDSLDGLMVEVSRLDTDAEGFTFESDQVGWTEDTGNGPTSFYPTWIEMPEPGRWQLVATSGPDWGCFILDLRGL